MTVSSSPIKYSFNCLMPLKDDVKLIKWFVVARLLYATCSGKDSRYDRQESRAVTREPRDAALPQLLFLV